MELLTLAPSADSYDFWIALACCFGASLIWLVFVAIASRSGSIETTYVDGHRVETPSNKNVSIVKTGFFKMFLLHLVLGTIIFIIIASDRWGIWFI